ncbi:MFS transporter [Streptomyces sp. NPDC002659]|uniref:MFS transporter n=1 Tax=Streptomyces sp. NPDC002659 TaxID=3364656 RepID=UPI0036BF39B5
MTTTSKTPRGNPTQPVSTAHRAQQSNAQANPPDGNRCTDRTSARVALRDHRIWLWLGGDALSSVGDRCTSFALTFASVPLLGPSAAGMALAALGIPRLLLPLWAGALADRFPPRRLLLACHLARAVLVAALAMAWTTHPSVTTLLTTTILLGVGASLADPAARALAPQTVKPADLLRITAIRSAANRTAILIGGPLAGLLLSLTSPATVLAIDAASFALATLTLTPLPQPAHHTLPGRPGMTREISTGLRYATHHPLIGPALLLFAMLNLAVCGPVELGITQLAHDQHWLDWRLGMLLGAFGVGATAAALALAAFTHRLRRHGHWALTATTAAAASLLLMATTTRVALLLPTIAILGATAAAANLLAALIQHATPPEMTGRVSGLITTAIWGTWGISFAVSGHLLRTLGLRPTLLLAAAALGATTLLCTWVSPQLRQYRAPTNP